MSDKFEKQFEDLTGKKPLSWQTRLFDRFVNNDIPAVIDLPTGLGKTMVMAIWLIARSVNSLLPRRLIYVVDRRTVVDQATEIAEDFAYLLAPDDANRFEHIAKRNPKLIERKKMFADTLSEIRHGLGIADSQLSISTLRGQLADNREWSRDPSRPAIIIGTVDLIGSALLFSGYRSSYKRRPLQAGLLGQDSLLVLDEAHLSKPFEKLIRAIGEDGSFQKNRDSSGQGKPMCVIRMSATSGDSTDSKPPFTLQFENGTLTGEDAKDETITDRFGASKTLRIVVNEKVVEAIVTEADELAIVKPGSRIVIFVQTPKQVADVRKALEKKKEDYATRIAQLTGTMRGLERDELVDTEKPLKEDHRERRVMQRFLKPDNDPAQGVCFLISTSAGEVGFDLNADHLLGDETPLDSWIQRLGRVNRRGQGHATVILIKKKEPADKTDFDKACIRTSELLSEGMDLSPKNLAHLKRTSWSTIPEEEQGKDNPRSRYDLACSPMPTMVELAEILLDAWSMTSITQPMPGRPEVGPWLRGIAEWEPPQTTIAWRTELDLDGFADLDIEDVGEWFDAHRIRTHETLSVKTSDAADWLQKRWATLPVSKRREIDNRCVVIDRAGLEVVRLTEVITRLSRKGADADAFLSSAELIVPASFGGIRRGVGLLDPDEPRLEKDVEKKTSEEKEAILNERQNAIDVADVRGRYREKILKPEDGEPTSDALDPKATKPAKSARFALELESNDESIIRLVSYVPRREKQESGSEKQTLMQHVGAVRIAIDQILSRFLLPKDVESSIKLAAQFAADWHDHGKNREFFQRTVGGRCAGTVEQWQAQTTLDGEGKDQCLGKSGGQDRGKPARGYRHEFGSLREFSDAFKAGKLLDDAGSPISQEVFDLAAHLIATHHGRGRPHFPKGGFDPDCESQSDDIHVEAIRRFARLQRKYGWWYLAWLENLLRCADAMASASVNDVDYKNEPEAGK